jgi:hypothetical protein
LLLQFPASLCALQIPTLGFRAVCQQAAALKYFTMDNGALCVMIRSATTRPLLFAGLSVLQVARQLVLLVAEVGQSGWTMLFVPVKTAP